MFKEHIGKQSNKIKNVVERGMVKRFAEAIGDMHPIFVDEAVGRQSRYGQNIAPPTFPRVFDYGEIEGLDLLSDGLIHGEQIYHYTRPLLVGETVYCYTKIENYYDKKSRSGLLGFLIVKRFGEDGEGETIFTEQQSVIITEAVRKELVK
ncbi:MaoC family dehydratase N-terminal domain-containing protein [Virgibacillus alimentarius]|uniref:Acyl dehydratase n=1 Tax=Virgibacillus alimentarius TaxID=698769 RepID=A0ABS4S7W5_9BACI|nr:MaoC family dehydratase N-terminal domain-containing protein [Virgibacillus alimentarius]MBP2257594.1 acyl dehydratase [Virgibacillus alimentarius]